MSEALHVVCPHCDTTNRVPRARLGAGGKCGACHRPLFEGHPLPLNDPSRFAQARRGERHPAPDRLLGRLVRSVPHDGADRRAGGATA
ncbi:protein of unknown function (plasmid) [Azospirillum baldaniorum]|uniref:Thioredoxin 2 N-terminal domain-containing protein n=1 Tax=Azospirillum baldaniorum TaxID=1064539 RepID=A0A9P1JV20_9PROT|nr:protein of unknown function [Azospirillum baldaniorum]